MPKIKRPYPSLEIDFIASETPPAEKQGSNLTLSVHQGIPTPEFPSSYKAGYLI
jgi:hypothetical protein